MFPVATEQDMKQFRYLLFYRFFLLLIAVSLEKQAWKKQTKALDKNGSKEGFPTALKGLWTREKGRMVK